MPNMENLGVRAMKEGSLHTQEKTIEAASLSLGAQVFSIKGGRSPSFAPPKHQKRTTGFSVFDGV